MTYEEHLRAIRRTRIVLSVTLWLIVLAAVSYGLGLIKIPDRDTRLDGEIDDLIRNELALGSSTAQVKAWLISKKVNIIVYDNNSSGSGYGSVVDESPFKPNQLSGIIVSRLDTGHSLLSVYSTQLAFFFDKKGRLIGHSIRRGAIGL